MLLVFRALKCPHALGRGAPLIGPHTRTWRRRPAGSSVHPPEELAAYCAKQPDPEDCQAACAGDE
jgi:hypothetical protein